MDENIGALSLSQIKRRSLTAFMSLTARQIILRAISFISLNIILARILSVEVLGIFNIASAVITFFAFFSDIGLAASLIQKRERVTSEDIKTVFTIQQILVGLLSLIIIVLSPVFGKLYGLDNEGIWLIRILGFSFFLSSLKVVPAVLLERELRFKPLVTVEIVETVVFNAVLISVSFSGGGIWSFSSAALLRGLFGTVLIYLLAPITPRWGVDRVVARQLLSFGLPFQVNSLLAVAKDRLVPLVVARMIGATGMGFVTWSQALAFLPLEIMNVVIRITFPAFSRLQEDRQTLTWAVEKSLFLTALLVYPVLFGLGAILPSIVLFVVSSKWQPAVTSFYLFSFSTFWAVISTTFTNTLNAIGEIKKTLQLMIMWTILTWLLTPLLVSIYGFNGVAISSFLISFTSVLTIILVKRILAIKIFDAILLPTVASSLMGISIYYLSQVFVRDKITLALTILLGVAFYVMIVFLLGKERILKDLRNLRNG